MQRRSGPSPYAPSDGSRTPAAQPYAVGDLGGSSGEGPDTPDAPATVLLSPYGAPGAPAGPAPVPPSGRPASGPAMEPARRARRLSGGAGRSGTGVRGWVGSHRALVAAGSVGVMVFVGLGATAADAAGWHWPGWRPHPVPGGHRPGPPRSFPGGPGSGAGAGSGSTAPTSTPTVAPTTAPSNSSTGGKPTTTPTPSTTTTKPSTTTAAPSSSSGGGSSSSGGSSAPTSPVTAGVPSGTSLRSYSGPTTITQSGTVIDGADIRTNIDIQASNVTIRRSRLSGTGSFGIFVRSGSATIEDTTVVGFDNAVAGDNYTATRVEVTNQNDDGFKIGDNVTIQSSWCHDLKVVAGAHSDCGQIQSGVRNATVRGNWFDPGNPDGNSALFIAPDLGPSSAGPVVIDGNTLGGGNYTLFCVDGDSGRYYISSIAITNNRFLGDARYGSLRLNVPAKVSGNVMATTGASVAG